MAMEYFMFDWTVYGERGGGGFEEEPFHLLEAGTFLLQISSCSELLTNLNWYF
jgi:hypothetical protein